MFCVIQLSLAWRATLVSAGRNRKAMPRQSIESQSFLQAKLRNAETVEALGMLGNLRRRWLQVHRRADASARATR